MNQELKDRLALYDELKKHSLLVEVTTENCIRVATALLWEGRFAREAEADV